MPDGNKWLFGLSPQASWDSDPAYDKSKSANKNSWILRPRTSTAK